jgi:hypothetical protein
MALPSMSVHGLPKQLDERLALLSVREDRADPTIASSENVKETVRKVAPPCLGHRTSVGAAS